VTIDVTLAISARHLPRAQTAIVTVGLLRGFGGRLVSWTPDLNGAPARARFVFTTEEARTEFIAAATALAGVWVAAPGYTLPLDVYGKNPEVE